MRLLQFVTRLRSRNLLIFLLVSYVIMESLETPNLIYAERFDLTECIEWITLKQSTNVCLYFLPRFYCLSCEITSKLQQYCPDVTFWVMIYSSSGVDSVKYRLGEQFSLDAVIYFGASCLCPEKYSPNLPTLFMPLLKDDAEIEFVSECFTQQSQNSPKRILLLSDFTNSSILLEENFPPFPFRGNTDISKFSCADSRKNWHFPTRNMSLFENMVSNQQPTLCKYSAHMISNRLSQYDLVVYIGECANMELIISCKQLVVIDPQSRSMQIFDGPREFRKRISLVEKFKNSSVNLIGVVFLNYTQSVTPITNQTKKLCKRLKKQPYFLTLNQNDFESRLGNFGQLESFVFINSCDCNFEIAKSTCKYMYPVIFWKEFLIACSQKISYGGIEWNAESDHQSVENTDEDEEEKDEQSMKLVDRELFKRPDGWFGLVVDAGSKQVDHIKEGLRGIPSAYIKEEELF